VLSAILRRYLAEAYRFKAEELTTFELLQEMQRLKFKAAFLSQLRPYLLECDQVKFANVVPAPAAVESALTRASQLIQAPNKCSVPADEAAAGPVSSEPTASGPEGKDLKLS